MADSTNWRNLLQELLQKNQIPITQLEIIERSEGPPHKPAFQVQIRFPYFRNADSKELDTKEFSSNGTFSLKKEAIQNACKIAYLTVKDFGGSSSTSNSTNFSASSSTAPSDNYKGKVLEYCQKRSIPFPQPDITSSGPSHQPIFTGKISWNNIALQSQQSFLEKKRCEQHLYHLLWENISNSTQEHKSASKPAVPTVLTDSNMREDFISNLVVTKPRNYQIELYRYAIQENSICVLPTGTGKTLTSCMVIKRMKQLNPKRLVVFVVDRIPLLIQQSNAIRDETNFSVLPLSGGKLKYTDLSLREKILKHDVITITCDTLLRLFEHDVISLDQDVSLLVFDEAQHAVKNSPFAVVMKKYYLPVPANFKPKILGLTASPAAHEDHFMTIIEFLKLQKLLDSKIRIPESNLDELVVDPTIQVVAVPQMTNEEQELQQHIENAINEVSTLSQAAANNDNNRDMETDEVFVYQPESKETKYKQALNGIRDILDHFGMKDTIEELKKFFAEYDKAPLKEDITKELRPYVQHTNFHATKSKAAALIDFLKQTRFTVGLIFTKERKTAEKVLELVLSAKLAGIKPELLLGHDGKNSLGEKMTPRVQKQIVDDVKGQKINLIIATSVAEEGLDLKCDLVIRFDAPNSAIARIQSRGRARLPNSNYVIINRDDEHAKDSELQLQELNAKIALDFINKGTIPQYEEPYIHKPSPEDRFPAPKKTALQDMMEKVQLFAKYGYKLVWHSTVDQQSNKFIETACLDGPGNHVIASGEGRNKQEAHTEAANTAMKAYKLLHLYKQLVIPKFPEIE